MGKPRLGHTVPLSIPRRLVTDMLHFARKVPTVPVQRVMPLGALAHARSRAAHPISWCTLFVKAFGVVARRVPELRRAYMPFPYARLYEFPYSIASVAVERIYEGEPGVFFAHLHEPENLPLVVLEDQLRNYKEAPIWSIGMYRRAIRTCRLPLPLRRFAWWFGLNSSGPKRAKRVGTFGVSVYSSLGAESLHPMSPLTTTLTYGVVQPDGTVPVRLIYDHRVMDGATVARALNALEETLLSVITNELRTGTVAPAARTAGVRRERLKSKSMAR